MTEKGAAFVDRWKIVVQMAAAGTPLFAAMAAGLEEEDWPLVFAATNRLAQDVIEQAA
jgi:hypothetical protein